MTKQHQAASREHGQVAVFFALLLPVLLALSAVVIGIGNWYTHARHLQTKSDAGAFAGGNSWAFPCGPEVEGRIETQARLYAGPSNPQVGGVPNADVHSVLNGPLWYDDDSNPAPAERTTPPGTDVLAPICTSMTLDVKMTEDNSFPLASLMPLFPDIKKKARVEIQEAEGLSGVLPIAVRAPVPVSAAAVFFNESDGSIFRVRYLVKNNSINGLPGGLQGWTTFNPDDPVGSWADFQPAPATGVLLAVSFRGACNSGLPANNAVSKRITTAPGPNCFEDQGFANVNGANGLCNQGGGTQIVNCHWATGTWPNEVVQKGLHFIRGYNAQSPASLGNAPPQIESAWLEAGNCPTNGYFYTHPTATCDATLKVQVNLGHVMEDEPGNPVQDVQTRREENIDVKWGMRRSDGSTACSGFCDLTTGSGPNAVGVITYEGTVPLTAQTRSNAIAIEIYVKGSTVADPNAPGCGVTLGNFNQNCRWFHVGSGISSTSVNPVTNNGGIAVLNSPVQRGFRGDSIASGSAQWIRLTQDTAAPCDLGNLIDNEAASARSASNPCFLLDVGLKGGIAASANEQPILFNDGIGSSQMGSLDCDPNIQQGQILIDGVIQGCGPWYAQHPFDWNPLCPAANNIFAAPNPGAPWNDGRWPPLRCIKTRPTGSMNQLERGLDGRFFGNQNANQCPGGPTGGPGFIKGRNYWDKDTPNGYVPPAGEATYGYKEGSHDTNFNLGDPRIVTIFLTTTEAFAGSGQFTYPITGFIQVYITGYGRINGGGIIADDPCPGSAPPTDLDLGAGNTSGYAVWGHVINYVVPGPRATPSGRICTPVESTQPCVPVLVE